MKKKKDMFEGEVAVWYLMLYCIGRFVIEFYRGDLIRGGLEGLSTSQIISLIMFALAAALLVYLPRRQKALRNK